MEADHEEQQRAKERRALERQQEGARRKEGEAAKGKEVEKKAEMARRAKITNEQELEDSKRHAGDARAEAARLQVGRGGWVAPCLQTTFQKSWETTCNLSTCNLQRAHLTA